MAVGIINTGSFAKALWPGVRAWFGATYTARPPEYPDAFEKDTSDKNYEEEVMTTSFGLAPIKPEGSPISNDAMSQFFVKRYTNVVYALGFQISREAIEDNQYASLAKQRSQSLAFSMRQTKENVAANIFNRGFNSTYVGGDGVALFSASHPTETGTFSNLLGTASDLNGLALEQACIDISLFVNNRGLRIKVLPQKLLIHPSNMFEAERILKSSLEYSTANNAINALKSTNALPEGYAVNHYVTDQDAWYVLNDSPGGLKYFQRRALELAPAENDYDTENAQFKASERYVFGWTDPRGAYGTPGA